MKNLSSQPNSVVLNSLEASLMKLKYYLKIIIDNQLSLFLKKTNN